MGKVYYTVLGICSMWQCSITRCYKKGRKEESLKFLLPKVVSHTRDEAVVKSLLNSYRKAQNLVLEKDMSKIFPRKILKHVRCE